jgi:DNA-binding NarL/FixJ family response regulator
MSIKELNLLVVDDDAFSRKLIMHVLHDLEFVHVYDADNAVHAIKLLESNTFDLIITDVNMPEMNGLELTQLIREGKTAAKPETRIVILTSFSQLEILKAAMALDINGFLVKPMVPAVVEKRLIQAMTEQLHLHPSSVYESVKTKFDGLPNLESGSVDFHEVPGNYLGGHKTANSDGDRDVHYFPIERLCPGMILKEDVYLPNKHLLLSSGHALTELSINRMHDLGDLLSGHSFAIAELHNAD